MKTINDLFELAILQVELNKSKLVKYHIVIDTSYKWLSLVEESPDENGHYVKKPIITHMLFHTPEELQECYWFVHNRVRTK